MKLIGMHGDLIANQVKKVVEGKDYRFFDGNLSHNANIVGVRNNVVEANYFDDMLMLIQRNRSLEWEVYSYRITTDPGTYWLQNPENVDGTAMLVPGQYSSYQIDKHQGKYDAICQRRGPVKVWRDKDKDKILDWHEGQEFEGTFGINIHRSTATGESNTVDRWSAGCQVFKNISDYNEFMTLCKQSAAIFGNNFTYTLLERADIE